LLYVTPFEHVTGFHTSRQYRGPHGRITASTRVLDTITPPTATQNIAAASRFTFIFISDSFRAQVRNTGHAAERADSVAAYSSPGAPTSDQEPNTACGRLSLVETDEPARRLLSHNGRQMLHARTIR
jgi:hypothetical protein